MLRRPIKISMKKKSEKRVDATKIVFGRGREEHPIA